MNWKRFLLSLVFLVVLLLVSFLILGQWSLNRSRPDYSGTLSFQDLHDGARITRDANGVPFIQAQDPYDLFFAWGFCNAQDRIWQMEYLRRLATGRLSQIMGPSSLSSDKLARTIGFTRLADQSWQACDEITKRFLQAYVKGINAYLQRSRKTLPPEFSLKSFTPEPWSPIDPLAIWHFFSFNMAGVWSFDLFATALVNKTSPAAAKQLYTILDGFSETRFPLDTVALPWQSYNLSGMVRVNESQPNTLEYTLVSVPHLPNLFYWVHLESDSINVAISHIPGTPFAWSGTESGFTWSMIPSWSDRVDFYAETIDPRDTTRYVVDGTTRPLDYQEEIIHVYGQPRKRLLIRRTHHGPLVDRTGIYESSDNRPLSLAWAGPLEGKEFDVLYRLLSRKGRSKIALFDSLIHLNTSSVFLDGQGNYGYHQSGAFPVRRPGTGLFVMDGSKSLNDWNDERVVNAGNQTRSDTQESLILMTSMINQTDEYPSQVIREDIAMEHLENNPTMSLQDYNPLSFHAKETLPGMLSVLQQSISDSASVYALITLLKQLDPQTLEPQIAATFFELYYNTFFAEVFQDQMGDLYPIFKDWPVCDCTYLSPLFSGQSNFWVDDIHTRPTESVDDLVVRAFNHTLDSVRLANPDLSSWSEDNKIAVQPLLPLQRSVALLYGLEKSASDGSIFPIQNVQVTMGSEQTIAIRSLGGQSGHPYSDYYHVERKDYTLSGSTVGETLFLIPQK